MRAQTPHDPEELVVRPELPSGDAQVRAPSADLERLAKAARDYEWDGAAPQQEWDSDKHYWIASVRAVLTAMREPTQAQYDALCATDKMWRELDSKTVWQTYIDALLSDGGEAGKTGNSGTPK